jgi:hypothetical protein
MKGRGEENGILDYINYIMSHIWLSIFKLRD